MKKLATILALTAVVANLGVSAVFAQVDATGTQDLGCPTTANTSWDREPTATFAIGTGSRTILNTNDDGYTETLNSAYFPNGAGGPTDPLSITSDTPYNCGDVGNAVSLQADSSLFQNVGGLELKSFGPDLTDDGGVGTRTDDYYPIFSIHTATAAECTGATCTLADGSVESDNAAKNGNANFFSEPTANVTTADPGSDSAALLSSELGALNSVILYSNSLGMSGNVTVPMDYNLALPANVSAAGTYTSTVTFTLA